MNDPHDSTSVAPTVDHENMPPPPPRPPDCRLTPTMAAAETKESATTHNQTNIIMENSVIHDGILRQSTNGNGKRQSEPMSPRDSLPPRHPKRTRTLTFSTSVNENDHNFAKQFDGEKEVEEEEDPLEYSGPLSDQEDEDEAAKDTEENDKQVTSTTLAEFYSMMKMGLKAFQDRERLLRENTKLKEDNAIKTSEVARLRLDIKQNKEIITVRSTRVSFSFCLHCS